MNKFILLSLKRSGSTFLVSALNNHPEIKCAGEIFKAINPLRIIHPEYSYFHTRNENLKSKALHFLNKKKIVTDHLNKIYGQNSNQIFGFKLMPRQIQRFPQTRNYIVEHKIPVILLVREHYLERLVSIKVAAKTKVFGAKNSHQKLNKIILDTSSLIQDLDKMQAQTNEMKELAEKTNHLIISYEDLTVHKVDETQEAIFTFLNTASGGLESNMKKLIKNPLDEIIENYEEVAKVLSPSKFNHLL